MTEEELARHNSKTLLQLLLSADARCDALTAERDRLREALVGLRFIVPRAMKALMDQGRDGLLLANEIHRADDKARAALKGETK